MKTGQSGVWSQPRLAWATWEQKKKKKAVVSFRSDLCMSPPHPPTHTMLSVSFHFPFLPPFSFSLPSTLFKLSQDFKNQKISLFKTQSGFLQRLLEVRKYGSARLLSPNSSITIAAAFPSFHSQFHSNVGYHLPLCLYYWFFFSSY